MRFFLGTHLPDWLGKVSVPLFVSRNMLKDRRTFPRAIGPWALDSGGFSEIAQHGRWTIGPEEYVGQVRHFAEEIGSPDWAAPQDWMCEPSMLRKTGFSILEHQRRTISNFVELRELWPDGPFIPVLQGWGLDDYLRHVDQYAAAGIDLRSERIVGIGTVCRRSDTLEAERIIRTVSGLGLTLHAFGVKISGLGRFADCLNAAPGRLEGSADSMAWSYAARRRQVHLAGCTHKQCNNCSRWALLWRQGVLRAIASPKQPWLFSLMGRDELPLLTTLGAR